MFDFLKKLNKKEKKEIINYSYDQNAIHFKLNRNFSSGDAVQLYNNLFNDLAEDGFGTVEENILSISHNDIYPFLKDDRSKLFPIPKYFDGTMEVKHRGFLDRDAIFEVNFIQNDTLLFSPKIIGSILELTENTHFLLPESMYQSYLAIKRAEQSNDTALRYSAIETMQSFEDNGVYYKGLKENDFIKKVDTIGIDIIENDTGELDIYPLILGLETEFIVRNSSTIAKHPDQHLILTNQNNEKTIRYILEEKQLKSAKAIIKTKRIPKEQADQFKTNPESFFAEDDIQAVEFSKYRLIRVTELRTEPYIGFFGSTKMEAPMSQVLTAGDDIALTDKKDVKAIIDDLDDIELEQLQMEVEKVKEKGEEYISIKNSDPIPLEIVESLLKECLQEDQFKEFENKETKQKNEFLGINPNDEEGIGSNNDEVVCIKNSAKKQARDWQNISDRFKPKPHQIVGFNWLKTLYENGYKGGLLADDMGLGKTFQVIAFINYLYNTKSNPLDHSNQRILIVAPSILLTSWKNEIENIIIDKSAFRVKILQGRNFALKKLCDSFKEGPDTVQNLAQNSLDIIDLLRYNIFITTYETLSINQLAFANKDLFNFELCIFDEAQKIKNPNARITQAAKAISANTPFTIVVTGTPIENELRDLWSLFDAFDPTYIGSWKSFRERYVKPIENEKNIGKVDKELRKKIGDYMLRRLKKDHLQGLPEKHLKFIEVPMHKDEIKLHNEIANSSLHSIEKLQKLRILSLHPKLLDMEDKLDKENFIQLSNPEKFFKSSKMSELLNLLNNIKAKEEKVLIFVIRHTMQTLLQTALQKHYGFKIDIINGKNNKQEIVDKKLEQFESKKGFNILLLSPLAAGIGLTITAANHVIHLERHWNPAKEDQASDRIYRIGQEKDVYIYHLIHTAPKIETFDSGLNKLITNKKSLSDGTLIPTPSIKDSEMVESFFNNLDEIEKWDLMSPEEFEIEVMRLYEKLGYRCHITSKIPTELGADIIATKGNETVAIQCKHTRVKKRQGRDAIRQLIAETKLAYPEAKLVAVTNFYFNDNARNLAKSHNIKLIEREQLLQLTLPMS